MFFYVDYTVPVERLREKLGEILAASPLWDREVGKLQVTEVKESTVKLRAIMTARSAGDAFELRCEVREKMIAFLQAEYPGALPHQRQITVVEEKPAQGKKSAKGAARARPV